MEHIPSIVELLLFLCNPAVNLLLDLAKLQLGSQHLVLLGLKAAFSLLKRLLQLFLLSLQPPPLFVQLVDGTAAIAKLVEQILDLVGEVLKISI